MSILILIIAVALYIASYKFLEKRDRMKAKHDNEKRMRRWRKM